MEALLYDRLDDNEVRCRLCCHRCVIADGRRGICRVRENRGGVLHSLVYGRLVARHVDPIEKKPLYHFLPGSLSYSIATVGCNLRCRFCQNADIAQMPADRGGAILGETATPAQVVEAAGRAGCRSISYTYTEPTVFFEFALETARLARNSGLRNVFVTNGYMTPEAIDLLAPVLDAANVDLKGFTQKYYKGICGADLAHVQETLRRMRAAGIFVEVTTLIVPGLNDDPAELEALAGFLVAGSGAGHALAHQPLPPHLPPDRPAAHPGRDPAPGARNRPRGRAALRLRRQRAGRRGREHPVPGLRRDAGRTPGVPGGEDAAEGRPLPGLRDGD